MSLKGHHKLWSIVMLYVYDRMVLCKSNVNELTRFL